MAERHTPNKDPNTIIRIIGGLAHRATGRRRPNKDFQEALKKDPGLRDAYLDGAAKAQREKEDGGNHPADE